jgi:hypothetical protein
LQRGLEGIEAATEQGFQVSQERVPVNTGHLKSTGHIEKESELVQSIIYDSEYASYVEHGTEAVKRDLAKTQAEYEMFKKYKTRNAISK